MNSNSARQIEELIKRKQFIQASILCSRDKIPIPQALYDATMRRAYNEMMSRNVPDFEVEHLKASWKGGTCPSCGVHYRKVTPDEVIEKGESQREYVYFLPACQCFDQQSYDAERDRAYKTLKIPKEFRGASLTDWDSRSNHAAFSAVCTYAKTSDDDKPRGIIFHGSPGTGKTRAAFSLMIDMYESGKRCVYVPIVDLIKSEFGSKRGESYITEILQYDFLLLDDMDKIGTTSEWVQNQIFGMIDTIYRDQKWFCITTNADKKRFCSPFLPATADRIAAMFWVEFSGTSYRTRKQFYKEN